MSTVESKVTHHVIPDKLDPSLYKLKEDEAAFYKAITKIDDDDELKQHIFAVQKEAFEIFPFPCIQAFRFLSMKISRFAVYPDVLVLGKDRKGAILLDIGCCFGNDARKAAFDGFPADQIIASDLIKGFWNCGNKLFKDSSDQAITFVPGDLFDNNFLTIDSSPVLPSAKPGEPISYPSLSSLDLKDTLNPLRGKISAIHASSFFHLFDEEKQTAAARKLAALLSPEPGSIIFGSHASGTEKKVWTSEVKGQVYSACVHSPGSWKEMWENEVFRDGGVVVEAHNVTVPEVRSGFLNIWTVRRV